MKEVCAVVVTYNKLDLLKRSIGALRKSDYPIKEIIVVDNLSTDGTRGWLTSQPDLRLVLLDSNLGGAGGFHHGMAEAVGRKHEWIWLMDDDSIVEPTALTELIRATDENPLGTFYNSMVLWTDGSPCRMNIPKPIWEWTDIYIKGTECIPLEACSFVSCLVNGAIARSAGLPIKEFFIWYDDFEYTTRLSRTSPGYFVPRSRVVHETAFNKGVDWSEVNKKTVWKYRHGLRNELSLIVSDQSFGKLRAFSRLIECLSRVRTNRPGLGVMRDLCWEGMKGIFTKYRDFIEYAPKYMEVVERLTFSKGHIPMKSYPGQGWGAVWGDDTRVMTHPAEVGTVEADHAYIEFLLPAYQNDMEFEATVSMIDLRAHSVEFRAEVHDQGQVVADGRLATAPSEGYRLFSLPIPPYQAGAKLRLYVTMSSEAPNFLFASSIWSQPRLVRKIK